MIEASSYVWSTSQEHGNSLLVLLALADWSNAAGQCFPGIPKIAEKTRMSQRNVQIILGKLRDKQIISIEENAGMKTRTGATNRYTINGFMEWSQEVKQHSSLSNEGVKNSAQGVKSNAEFDPEAVNPDSPKPLFKRESVNREPTRASAQARAPEAAAQVAASPAPAASLQPDSGIFIPDSTQEALDRWADADKADPQGEMDTTPDAKPLPPKAAPPPSPTVTRLLDVCRMHGIKVNEYTPGDIQRSLNDFAEDWVDDALAEAQRKHGETWSYVAAILSRWQRDGRKRGESGGAGAYPPYDRSHHCDLSGGELYSDEEIQENYRRFIAAQRAAQQGVQP